MWSIAVREIVEAVAAPALLAVAVTTTSSTRKFAGLSSKWNSFSPLFTVMVCSIVSKPRNEMSTLCWPGTIFISKRPLPSVTACTPASGQCTSAYATGSLESAAVTVPITVDLFCAYDGTTAIIIANNAEKQSLVKVFIIEVNISSPYFLQSNIFSRRAAIPTFGYNLTPDNHFFVSYFFAVFQPRFCPCGAAAYSGAAVGCSLTRVYIWCKHIENFLFMQNSAFCILFLAMYWCEF